MANLTSELVTAAYDALASGSKKRCQQYWADDMVWLVPGHNQLSGIKNGLDEFLAFMQRVGQLSGNSFRMDPIALLITGDYSADITHNVGHRAGDESRVLDINVIHLLRWRDGKVVEGRAAIFGDGTAQYDQFWS
ncbi:MAG: nuclear transport factor 2 family protein [Verrucomicrobia bacterium]|nr:nuclear transport factor 2 family protein [Verrucomicrobiota bacterium]